MDILPDRCSHNKCFSIRVISTQLEKFRNLDGGSDNENGSMKVLLSNGLGISVIECPPAIREVPDMIPGPGYSKDYNIGSNVRIK